MDTNKTLFQEYLALLLRVKIPGLSCSRSLCSSEGLCYWLSGFSYKD